MKISFQKCIQKSTRKFVSWLHNNGMMYHRVGNDGLASILKWIRVERQAFDPLVQSSYGKEFDVCLPLSRELEKFYSRPLATVYVNFQRSIMTL